MRSTLAILSLGFSLLMGASALAQETNGVMMVVKGDIKVTSGKDSKTEAAKVGRKVFSGDTIIAGPDSRAKIVMSDKNILNISPDSKMTIEKYTNDAKTDTRSVELKVEYGKVRASVEQKYDGEKSKFNIKTPTAVAGVRGTDFITGFNPGTRQSSIVTFSGTVAVGTPGPNGTIKNPVFVQPGQTTNVGAGGQAEPPKAMPKDQLKQMNNESSADTAKSSSPNGNQQAQQSSDNKKDDKKDSKDNGNSNAANGQQQDQGNNKDSGKKDGAKSDSASNSGNGNGSRAPASDSSAGNQPPANSGSTSGPANSSNPPPAAPAPGSSAPPPTAAPPSMINAADLNTSVGSSINANAGAAPRAPTSITPVVPVVPVTNSLVNQIIQNSQSGKSKVNIIINH